MRSCIAESGPSRCGRLLSPTAYRTYGYRRSAKLSEYRFPVEDIGQGSTQDFRFGKGHDCRRYAENLLVLVLAILVDALQVKLLGNNIGDKLLNILGSL